MARSRELEMPGGSGSGWSLGSLVGWSWLKSV